jgi:response regulator NasT
VITDIRMPGLDGLEAVAALHAQTPAAVILVSAYADAETVRRAEEQQVFAFLVKPIKQRDLAPAIAVAVRRHEQFAALRREAADLRQALEDRKVIAQAKGLVMKAAGIDEAEAFRRLQKFARDHNKKLVDVAHALILAEAARAANAQVCRLPGSHAEPQPIAGGFTMAQPNTRLPTDKTVQRDFETGTVQPGPGMAPDRPPAEDMKGPGASEEFRPPNKAGAPKDQKAPKP